MCGDVIMVVCESSVLNLRTQILNVLLSAGAVLFGICGCHESAPVTADVSPNASAETAFAPNAVSAAHESSSDPRAAGVREFCGACHAVPRPDSFPKQDWYNEVRRGFDFYYQSGRRDLSPPAQAEVVAFYRMYAPENLAAPQQQEETESRVSFRATDLNDPTADANAMPAVSFLSPRVGPQGAVDLWVSDMRSGQAVQIADVGQYHASAETAPVVATRFSIQGAVSHPAVVREYDLEEDGIADLLVTELGSFLPEDHDRGKLVWIPDGASAEPREPVVLLAGIGRVADVNVADMNGDDVPDLVVAEFGWHKTGGLHLLTGRKSESGTLTFSSEILDSRSGAIHAVPSDLDGDQRTDLVVVFSQEHENVVAFMNRPDGFHKEAIYNAPDPSWGSSGIQLTDLDNDGDIDVIYTNGDSFDSYLIKPYHGVWWLENTGSRPFEAHHIAAMPGVHSAVPADLDGDGDQDLVAAAMLPSSACRDLDVTRQQAVVWLEQINGRQFVRHVIERGRPVYAAMTVGDFDGDNRPDIAVGGFYDERLPTMPMVRIFWNERPAAK